MTELAPPSTHCLPPALALLPELRRPAARLRLRAWALHDLLLAIFPVAGELARDRTIAEHTSTTPYDHLAADTIVAVCHLVDSLDELARPIILVPPPPTPNDTSDDLDF